ncbi:unnamed protein product [Peniophora sp. CBMAI 1063]|nr:unnamed protein product [Peniophora sp. CBMAI 1063]
MFNLLSRRVAVTAARAPLRANSSPYVYQRSPIYRTFFSAPVLADPAAKAAAAKETGSVKKKATKKTAKKPAAKPKPKPKPKKAAPKPKPKKVKKAVPPPKPRFIKSMMPPRRPAYPYVIFATEYFARQSEVKASLSAHDVSREDVKALIAARGKAAGVAWHELPQFEKDKYRAEYEKRLEQYRLDLAAWQQSVEPQTVKIINDHRRKRKLPRVVIPVQGPKRPLSSYLLFSQEKMDEVKRALPPGSVPTEFHKELGRLWNNLSDEEKQPYAEKGKELMEAYSKAKAEYVADSA